MPAPTSELAFRVAWEAALDALELDVARAEQALTLDRIAANPPQRWVPPVGLGALPAELATRARALLGRQLEVSRRLAEAAALSRSQLTAVRSMRQRGESTPVYLDVPA
ncbi:hypothetical protein OEB99_00580 [Actinotalea sp. M2MS4P-6]|uniref:hypothetical protein n=1 Tax=Actinotalea sp. M2MS4P-6 TaxID=2983762 RepID=UPI0021E38F62|nr:hypothetical protein [Actinotalea sp. M2MS4P-6]MCV2392794.1 hypothetical protein [Actinotalea sp. M2MS4P-6]